MLKVLIADDENRIIKFLQTSVPWVQLGLELTACVSDGNKALKIATEQQINIVITDIRMPSLDGLELCNKLYAINSNIQIIIISGYADFEYAKKAIKLQVLGYCLKPIDENEIIYYLRNAIKNIRKETTLNGDYLLDSIEENNELGIVDVFKELGIDEPYYYVAVSVGVHNVCKILNAELAFKLGKHKYLYFSSHEFDIDSANHLICYNNQKGGIGIYPISAKPNQLKKVISDTTIMAHQFFINNVPTLCEKMVESCLTEDLFSNLKESLNSIPNLIRLLKKLKSANLSMLLNSKSAFLLYDKIYSSNLIHTNGEKEDFRLHDYEQLIGEYECFNDVLNEMLNILTISPNSENQPVQSTASSFMKIIKYLNENYQKNITLKKLSDMFHMNSSYVSQLIKSETGLTYSQYLTELRIGKAKNLLQTSDLSLSEISEAVGFNDYFYFIKKFKKVVGVTPGKYQAQSIDIELNKELVIVK